jgi:proteasome lid subunit RPN8/RPN11
VVLRLDSQHLASIQAHANSTYPEECCGLLLGTSDPTGKTVMEVRATSNAWEGEADSDLTKKRRYTIPPEEMLAAMKDGRDRGLDIIGIYHSHPDNPAEPSECDRAAAWQHYSYVIVSVPQGKAGEMRSWSLDDHGFFQPEKIAIASPPSGSLNRPRFNPL